MVWSIGLLAVLIGLDQALKYWTVTHLALGESAELIPGFLQLTRLHNYGAAWSSLSGKVVAPKGAAIIAPVPGVSSEGLNTAVLPASSAGTICPFGRCPGKL